MKKKKIEFPFKTTRNGDIPSYEMKAMLPEYKETLRWFSKLLDVVDVANLVERD